MEGKKHGEVVGLLKKSQTLKCIVNGLLHGISLVSMASHNEPKDKTLERYLTT